MHRNLLAKINRLIIATVVLFGMTAIASASESEGRVIPDNVENAACERLDIRQLAQPPAHWISDKTLPYIEAYVDNRCEDGVPNVHSEGRLVDLAYMNELFSLMPSGRVMTTTGKGEYRLDLVKAKIEREMRRSRRSGSGISAVDTQDALVAMYLECQLMSYMFLQVCDVRNIDYMFRRAKAMSQEEQAEIVNAILYAEGDKKRYKDMIKNELEK
jgi:hypothetical protein